jgi:DNA polymerase-4
VLPPDLRSREGVTGVLKKLLSKAATRLRKEGYFVQHLGIQVKFINPVLYWEDGIKMDETQDTFVLLRALNRLLKRYPLQGTPLRVGVVFSGLVSQENHQFSLFENPGRIALIEAMDSINSKYGKDTLRLGAVQEHLWSAPPRIAFQRVPELDEF